MSMLDKKRRTDDSDVDDVDAKKPPGRPKVLPPDLDKRHQLRCSSKDFGAWRLQATKLGFPNVSAWIRKVVNDALPKRRPAR